MEYRTLRNSIQIPQLGIGTFQLRCTCARDVIEQAIQTGYRLIDTASAYLNEKEIGEAIQDGVASGKWKREDFFLCTKIWPTQYEDADVVEQTLERLQTTYIDLLMLHQPVGKYTIGYQRIEQAYREGKVKAIGVSNMSCAQLQDLLDICEIAPHVVQWENHPYCYREEEHAFLQNNGIQLMSWYPLGHANERLLQEPILKQTADKYGKSVVQILLRWQLEKGMVVIPGTKNPSHMEENLDVFDFGFNEEDRRQIDSLYCATHFYQASESILRKYETLHLPYERKRTNETI